MSPSKLFFDDNDHTLLRIVNDILDRSQHGVRTLLASYMHPHGIKELAAPRVLRIAYAIASLLGTLEGGKAVDRLGSLMALKDEILLANASFFQKNTARVLLQIMKELIRHRDDEHTQLLLAHDFRLASTGKPRIVRAELAKYHLLEMPEAWNQLAFDDHVHDANTKGRKSPTHLVMDAWIKGVRFLTVVYYNYVEASVATELLEAAAILGMHIRIGIEVSSRFRDKYVRIIWEPQSYTDPKSFQSFLEEKPVQALMKEGLQVSAYQQKYVFGAFHAYNRVHRQSMSDEFGLDLDELKEADFIKFVGTGQPSLLHLAKFIQNDMHSKLKETTRSMAAEYATATRERCYELQQRLDALNAIDSELIIIRYLQPCRNPDLHDPTRPQDSPDVPPLLYLEPRELLPRLAKFHSNSRFTLNLSNLSIPDTLEVLYDCKGHINNIELYNIKDASRGKWSMPTTSSIVCPGDAVDLISPERTFAEISELQKALNDDNVIALKRAIRGIIWTFEEERLALANTLSMIRGKADLSRIAAFEQELEAMDMRKAKLIDILFDIEAFHKYYKKHPLGSRIGSGSTGQSRHQYGMGVVVLDTLPTRAQKMALGQSSGQRKRLPITALMTVHFRTRCHGLDNPSPLVQLARKLPGLRKAGYQTEQEWFRDDIEIHPGQEGNIVTLGGVQLVHDNGLRFTETKSETRQRPSLKYLNTALKNSLKILLGFIPAFLTFALTKDWWVLAYLGAFIWFGITGVRNILQAVLGGGGFKRSPLVQWNSLISWGRVADDLLFTGFSVPLLDLLIKTLLLDRGLGVTTSTNPVLLFAVMALANGIYISSHNTFRGLPRNVIVANFFRSILSIPLAVLFNATLTSSMHMAQIPGVEEALQKWATIVSKLASDVVAAIIEGLGDRFNNIRIRLNDYRAKLNAMFVVYARLDVLFPEEDVLDMLQSPHIFLETISYEAKDLEKVVIVNALDLMYFWLYQPRAPKALTVIVKKMSNEEWLIFQRSQYVLRRYREISQLFVDGLVGKNFSKALAFYLDRSDEYLRDLEKLDQIRRI